LPLADDGDELLSQDDGFGQGGMLGPKPAQLGF